MRSKESGRSVIDPPLARSDGFYDLSIEEWIAKFGRIYGKRHDKHTTEYMISRLVEEVAELVSPMESRGDLGPGLADVFSWICSLAYKLNLDLAALAWQKYGSNPPKTKRPDGSPSLEEFSQPRSLRDWQLFISKLYAQENATLSPMNALVALMKDVGDLSMLNRKRATPDQITSKLSAILAWTLALSQLLRLDLSEVVYAKYDDHCPVCLQTTCDTDICHPLVNMFVSFGEGILDEEKYAVLDTVSRFGYHAILSNSSDVTSTRDISTSFDLISRCDAACLVLPKKETTRAFGFGRVFEVLTCYSMLSRGNIWIFARDESSDFKSYLENVFSSESISISSFSDSSHLRAILEIRLRELEQKKRALMGSRQ